MAALVFKLGALVLRTVAKPLGNRFQAYIMDHPTARVYAIGAAQRLHRLEVWVTRAADGKTGRTFVADMTEERSVELASKIASEGFVFTVGLVVVGLEYERLRQRSAARRAADAAERAALLEAARKEREALAADNMQQASLIQRLVGRIDVLERQLSNDTQRALEEDTRPQRRAWLAGWLNPAPKEEVDVAS
uniref:OPA3-like protein n=1 Tax=Chlamydomonas euryale TaxID=1486919 RepID=A0A7R9V0X5_9CHLO|mmetsp:Transcript_13366/g.38810  ORF Transcript_13366/g.38810 Transcript_13366/m.38810 type:complete len:192 (+) Transcript_13366:199-774(+)